jgi:carbon monoxide dehydrogenase subunit G
MFHTDAQVEFKQTLRRFTEAARVNYDGHAYAAGYLESMAVQMLAVMSKREQQGFIKAMQEAARTQQQQAAAKERV